jgi:predicted molibdopterin-dependent oxidoreductase YjgC
MTSEAASQPAVELEIDGATTRASEGQTIAALLISLGIRAWRRTPEGEPRRAFCGIGMCDDCVVTVDGVAGVKACLTPVRYGMQILTRAS